MTLLRKITFFILPALILSFAALSIHDISTGTVSESPYVAHAAEEPPEPPVPDDPQDGSSCEDGKLCNPLLSQSIEEFLIKIVEVLIVFAVPIIVLFIMYAGFLFVTARGDTEQIKTARRALLWSVVGGVIALGAKLIITVIQGTIEGF